ncbi:hypothetical protein HED60_07460 [Planctomycetales bacterium ZRK34]|nr:hypothetical protein HED60_07460 [Planctomycetales bacterium ZRK34]
MRHFLIVLLLSCPFARAADYAVVVSDATQNDPAWRRVVDVLVKKHDAQVITWSSDVVESQPALSKLMPRYTCFVAEPTAAGRDFVVSIHHMTRRLDDDPYTDTRWAILTGYSADDALRIARAQGPLIIRSAAAGTGFDLTLFDRGKWYSEVAAGEYYVKKPGEKPAKMIGPRDSTAALVDTLNDEKPDLFITSGHATERDWQIGYSYRNGQFRCADGQLYGLDTSGNRLPIHSPNPKVYLPVGNCLMGHVDGPEAMALAFMSESGGVRQMIGYTVLTWFGRMGWGTRDYFFDLPSRYTLTEAFFFNNQAITHRLLDVFPDSRDYNIRSYDLKKNPRLIAQIARDLNYTQLDGPAKENVGLLWDRDTVALYGDPAYEARLAPRDLPITTGLTRDGRGYTLTITATADAQPNQPLAMMLPQRLTNINIIEDAGLDPLIADDFVMVLKQPEMTAGQTLTIRFTADSAP